MGNGFEQYLTFYNGMVADKIEVLDLYVSGEDYSAENKNWPSDIFLDFKEAIREEAGVNLEFKSFPDNQAFELALASGDLPDMFEVSREYCTALLNGNHVLALDDYLDQAPKLAEVSTIREEAMRNYYS